MFVVAPPAAIYFLYHFILEVAMHGRTPGKRMAGVHIVTRDGAPPTTGALLTRNVFRLVDSLPLFYGVGLVATMLTSDHVRVGDVAAGTLLVYDHTDATLLDRLHADSWGGKLDAAAAEVVHELLRRWSALDVDAHVRVVRLHPPRHLERGIDRVLGTDADLVVRIVLPREGSEVLVEAILVALYRLEDGDGRSVPAAPLAPGCEHEERGEVCDERERQRDRRKEQEPVAKRFQSHEASARGIPRRQRGSHGVRDEPVNSPERSAASLD